MQAPGIITASVSRNPYLAVSVRARLRRRATLLLGLGWVALIILCIELNYFLYSSPNYHLYPSLQHCFFSIFFQLLGIQFFVSLLPTAYYCSNSVSLERTTRSLPLLRATPLSGYAIALGKIASEPAKIWFLLVLAFPFTTVCAALGNVTLGTVAGGYVLMLGGAFFSSALGLLCSALGRTLTKPLQAGGASVGLVMAMVFASLSVYSFAPLNAFAALSPIPFFLRSITQRFPPPIYFNPNLNFLGAEVHPFFISFPLYILLGVGCLIGASHRIVDDNAPVLSRTQTLCGYVLYQLAISGMVMNFFHLIKGFTGRTRPLPVTGREPMVAYSLLVFAGIVLAAMVSTPVRYRLESALRKPRGKVSFARRYFWDDAASAFPLIVTLFAAATCGYIFFSRVVLMRAFRPLSVGAIGVGAAMLFFCVAISCLLIQCCYLTRGRQPVLVGAAVLVLYFVLPPVVSTILQLSTGGSVQGDYVYAVNPIYSLTRALSVTRLYYSPSDTIFLLLGTGIYVIATTLLALGTVLQVRGLKHHIDKMRKLSHVAHTSSTERTAGR